MKVTLGFMRDFAAANMQSRYVLLWVGPYWPCPHCDEEFVANEELVVNEVLANERMADSLHSDGTMHCPECGTVIEARHLLCVRLFGGAPVELTMYCRDMVLPYAGLYEGDAIGEAFEELIARYGEDWEGTRDAREEAL